MSKNFRQRGQILIEFILIAPVLLAIAGGAIEIARFLRFNQVASVFSQEAAMTAYRRCSDFFVFKADETFDTVQTQAAATQCLSGLRTTIENRLSNAYPTTDPKNPRFLVVLSVYRRDRIAGSGIGFGSLTRMISPDSAADPTAISSLYKISGNTIVREATSAVVFTENEITDMERIVIAEVAYMYSPVIPIYKLVLGNIDLIKTDRGFRETTIL
jgi:hypothetical protein